MTRLDRIADALRLALHTDVSREPADWGQLSEQTHDRWRAAVRTVLDTTHALTCGTPHDHLAHTGRSERDLT